MFAQLLVLLPSRERGVRVESLTVEVGFDLNSFAGFDLKRQRSSTSFRCRGGVVQWLVGRIAAGRAHRYFPSCGAGGQSQKSNRGKEKESGFKPLSVTDSQSVRSTFATTPPAANTAKPVDSDANLPTRTGVQN